MISLEAIKNAVQSWLQLHIGGTLALVAENILLGILVIALFAVLGVTIGIYGT